MKQETGVFDASRNGGGRDVQRRASGARRRPLPCALLALALVFAASCARDGSNGASASAPAAEEPRLDLSSDAPWPPEYSSDPSWQRAASGDDIDRARLARRESASTLLAAVRSGGSLGRVALSSFAYATDRYTERRALCELCERAEAASRTLLLEALLEAWLDAPPAESIADPAGDERCKRVLEALAQGEDTTPADRDRVAVLLGRLRAP